jgi:hypothetical protein
MKLRNEIGTSFHKLRYELLHQYSSFFYATKSVAQTFSCIQFFSVLFIDKLFEILSAYRRENGLAEESAKFILYKLHGMFLEK